MKSSWVRGCIASDRCLDGSNSRAAPGRDCDVDQMDGRADKKDKE